MTTKWMNTCLRSVIKTLEQRPLSNIDKVYMAFFETLQWLVFYCTYYYFEQACSKEFSVLFSQPAITCSKLTIETLDKVWNMFKVNNKDSSGVFINFEHISHLALLFLLWTVNFECRLAFCQLWTSFCILDTNL